VRKKNNSTGFYFLASLAVLVLSGSIGAMLLYRRSDAGAGQGEINDRSRICSCRIRFRHDPALHTFTMARSITFAAEVVLPAFSVTRRSTVTPQIP